MRTNIKLARLVDGSTIVGKEKDGSIEEAYAIKMMPAQGNTFQTLIIPFFTPLSKNAVNIDSSKVVVITDAPEDLAAEYTRATSNIEVVPGSALASTIPFPQRGR